MPSSKFVFPKNLDNVAENQPFTIQMAISKLETGNFVNAQTNYFAAPQQLNGQGQIKGHSHVVVELLGSLTATQPTDPNVFAFFKGLNAPAANGILTAEVDKGLPAGTYRLSSINTSANHAPAIVPVAQHGSLDDAVYFTVGAAAQADAAAVAVSFYPLRFFNNTNDSISGRCRRCRWRGPSSRWRQPGSRWGRWRQPSSRWGRWRQPSSRWRQPGSCWSQPGSRWGRWRQPSSRWR
jgi:hypothetical protein